MYSIIKICIYLLLIIISRYALADEITFNDLNCQQQISCKIPYSVIENKKKFEGLAAYLNYYNTYIVDKKNIKEISKGENIKLSDAGWFVLAGRTSAIVIESEGQEIIVGNSELAINSNKENRSSILARKLKKTELKSVAKELDQVRYSQLWKPFAALSKFIEYLFAVIHAVFNVSWGITIILFCVLLKIILLPVSVISYKQNLNIKRVKKQLHPVLSEIKSKYDGEEAHNRIMGAYKNSGVSPFYTLKPMLGLMIQIPILIAVFNVLSEMPQLEGQSIFWVENLAYPDTVGNFPAAIPVLGSNISLLPILMAIVIVLAAMLSSTTCMSQLEIMRHRKIFIVMAVVFFILFYTFPAAMVLYWTSVNFFNIFEQKLIQKYVLHSI